MAQCTKAEAKRLVKSISGKCHRLMASGHITTKQYTNILGCVDSMLKRLN